MSPSWNSSSPGFSGSKSYRARQNYIMMEIVVIPWAEGRRGFEACLCAGTGGFLC